VSAPLRDQPNLTRSQAERLSAVADFRLALRRFERASDRIVQRCGLTPRQHLLLLALEGRHAGAGSIGALANELGLAQSTVTELADRSQARGLVARAASRDDARVVLLRTTPRGRAILAQTLDSLDRERDDLAGAMRELYEALATVERRT
jgi:DNA-binding MarR family transcriptional regulator